MKTLIFSTAALALVGTLSLGTARPGSQRALDGLDSNSAPFAS